MNPVRRGGGIGDPAPRTDCQIISFNSSSGALSASSRFMRADATAPGADQSFFSSSEIRAGCFVKEVTSGVASNAWYIGVAAASYWLIGGRPRINSIVRRTAVVEYSVESTCCRFVYGLITLGYVLQNVGLALRGQAVAGCPLGNPFEIVQFNAWSAITFYLVVGVTFRSSLLGYFTAALAAGLTLVSLAL